MSYKRPQEAILRKRLSEPVKFINILAGPRQVGKTTIVRSVTPADVAEGLYISVDEEPSNSLNLSLQASIAPPVKRDAEWLQYYWQIARSYAQTWAEIQARRNLDHSPYIFVIDEIQKIAQWSEIVKGLWDMDRVHKLNMHVVLLGSAPLLMQQGLSETLAGRYEIISVNHWGFAEMQQAFDLSLEEYIYFGGYPGSSELIREDEMRWRSYVKESLIQPNIEKDILQLVRIKQPMLLKQLFELGCHYSGQELALNKMISAFNEPTHIVTLADYLQLLQHAKLLAGLQKYAGQELRKRNSVPKLNVFNTALKSALQDYSFAEAKADRSYWGRLVESAVGAHLLNTCDNDTQVFYWREEMHEIDFVLARRKKIIAFEVKSANKPTFAKGLKTIEQCFSNVKAYLVGNGGIALAEFLSYPADYWWD